MQCCQLIHTKSVYAAGIPAAWMIRNKPVNVAGICTLSISITRRKQEEKKMIRIKLSYQTEDELRLVLRLLGDHVVSWKRSKNQEGKYKKAYIELEILRNVKIC